MKIKKIKRVFVYTIIILSVEIVGRKQQPALLLIDTTG